MVASDSCCLLAARLGGADRLAQKLGLVFQVGALVGGEAACEPRFDATQFLAHLGDRAAGLADVGGGVDAGDLALGQHAFGADHRLDAGTAEMAGDGGIELEGEHRLDVALVDDSVAQAGDPAAGDGEPLAELGVLLLNRGDARRREPEGIAIVEGDAGRGGGADIGAAGAAGCHGFRRNGSRRRFVAHLRRGLVAGRAFGWGVALGRAAGGGGEKQDEDGNRAHDQSPLFFITLLNE